MFEKILYPTDFSGLSKDVLDVLKKNFPDHDVVVLHVVDTKVMDFSDRYAPEVFAGIEKNVEENARKKLKSIEDNLTGKGFAVTVRLERGVPFREILRVAEEEEVSLIIIGSHGMSNVAEMLLGSVSEKVVRKSTAPVLVVKRERA